MSDKFIVEILTPDQTIFKHEASEVTFPSYEGQMGILKDHIPLITFLRPGRVMVYGEDKNLLKAFFVSGGFAEVNPEKCIVLAESVDEINELKKATLEKEVQELEGQELDTTKEQLGIAKAKIDALSSDFYQKI